MTFCVWNDSFQLSLLKLLFDTLSFLKAILFLNKLNINKTIFWMFCWNKLSSDEKSFLSILFCSFSSEFIEVFEKSCDVLNEKWYFENKNNDCEFFNFWILDFVKFRLKLTSFEFFDWFCSLKFFELFELFDFIFSFSLSIFTKVLNF